MYTLLNMSNPFSYKDYRYQLNISYRTLFSLERYQSHPQAAAPPFPPYQLKMTRLEFALQLIMLVINLFLPQQRTILLFSDGYHIVRCAIINEKHQGTSGWGFDFT